MSSRSDPLTVFLWGTRWWLPGSGALADFSDDAEAVAQLVAHFAEAPKPVRLRLIYQPDTLQSVAVACPKSDRRTLAQALAGEYPALLRPDHAWSYEPILADGEGFGTVLHHEIEPRLISLAIELARHGLAIDSAWPLATYLQALPSEWSDTGACTVVAVSADRAFAYRQPAEGGRMIQRWDGEETGASVSRWVAILLERDPHEPVMLVCGDVEIETAIARSAEEAHSQIETLPLAKALGRAALLPRYHPAQLLPREPVVTAQRLMLAASILFLLTAGAIAGNYMRTSLAERATADREATEAATLQAEIAHLRENAAEIARLRSELETAMSPSTVAEILRKVAATIPKELVLDALRVEGRTLTLAGWVKPGTPSTVMEDWRGSWKANAQLQLQPNGSFMFTGGTRP